MIKKYFTRKEVVDYISSLGIPIAKKTLDKYATSGGGPKYRTFGRNAVYELADIDDWIKSKLSAPKYNTSSFAPETNQ